MIWLGRMLGVICVLISLLMSIVVVMSMSSLGSLAGFDLFHFVVLFGSILLPYIIFCIGKMLIQNRAYLHWTQFGLLMLFFVSYVAMPFVSIKTIYGINTDSLNLWTLDYLFPIIAALILTLFLIVLRMRKKKL